MESTTTPPKPVHIEDFHIENISRDRNMRGALRAPRESYRNDRIGL